MVNRFSSSRREGQLLAAGSVQPGHMAEQQGRGIVRGPVAGFHFFQVLASLATQQGFFQADDLVDAVSRRVKCNIKTIERVAFEELKVVSKLDKTSPPKAMWKLPSIET